MLRVEPCAIAPQASGLEEGLLQPTSCGPFPARPAFIPRPCMAFADLGRSLVGSRPHLRNWRLRQAQYGHAERRMKP